MVIVLVVIILAIVSSSFYTPEEKTQKNELSEDDLKQIFYASECYLDKVGDFGNETIEFKIDKVKNSSIKKIDKFSEPRFNLTYIDILYGGWGQVGDGLYISDNEYFVEKENITIWRVQGGIFTEAFAGSFHGCLEIIDAETGEILVQGFYEYS
ncbi:MAG: hypothetical protein ACFFG0_48635 [Candidatus Thorarchaeota archaeon]